MKKHNFSAGPSILPQEVFEKAAQAVLDFNGMGLSILEISHRSKEFIAVMEEARALVKKLMKLGDDYEVLFLQGGASLQFVMAPFNLMKEGGKAAYLDSGSWAAAAIKEGKKFGTVDVVGSSKEEKYSFIPKDYTVGTEYDFFHCTSNNTIYGTQMKEFPKMEAPIVCDMSSDIFSREIDFSQFGIIYAGAQKNMGPSGATLVVVKKDILGKTGRNIPSFLKYCSQAKNDSMVNTPATYAWYLSGLVFEWLLEQGGVDAIHKVNLEKAKLLYGYIDSSDFYANPIAVQNRSIMNVPFTLANPDLEKLFLKEAEENH